MDQRIIALYDEYTHAPLERRVFLSRLAALAGGGAAAITLLGALESRARAAVVAPDDGRLLTRRVEIAGAATRLAGYLAAPAGASDRLPGVLVIHENRGLNPHIEDIARRLAVAGYVALAPDLLTPAGGTPADRDAARAMTRGLDDETTLANAVAAVRYLRGLEETTDRVAAIGFCWGGALCNRVAAAAPELTAAVVYYGRQPPATEAVRINAELLLHYAGLDARVNAGIVDFEAVLKKNGIAYTKHVYEGVNHAFNNDTAGPRYDAAAARLAWSRTVAFLDRTLKS